jgi:hypothetical protein
MAAGGDVSFRTGPDNVCEAGRPAKPQRPPIERPDTMMPLYLIASCIYKLQSKITATRRPQSSRGIGFEKKKADVNNMTVFFS